jgi:alpha-1,2-mannosyltransferase
VAGAVFVFYVLPVPYYGANLLNRLPMGLARIVQDGYGLGAIALLFLLGIWLVNLLSVNSKADPADASLDAETVGTLAG